MSDILEEDVLTPAAGASFIQGLCLSRGDDGDRGVHHRPSVSPGAISRWMRKGVMARNGQRVHLEYVKLGRRYLTSRQALIRFSKRLAGDPAEPSEKADVAVEKAGAALREAGFFR